MEIIEVLDKYIEGDITTGNRLLTIKALELHNEPDRNIHKLLLAFKAKDLFFEVLAPPETLDQALEELKKTADPSEKYVYALYVLKYQNPITTAFVNLVLERIDAK